MTKAVETNTNSIAAPLLNPWIDPTPQDVGNSSLEFLHLLSGPTHIKLTGEDSSRSRAAVTLLHGNEPSGLHGVYEILRMGLRPAVDIHIYIASVEAAKKCPGFSYRMLPQRKDLNRCFKIPYGDSEEDMLAKEIIESLELVNPECVIDIHNTSGSSPSFGVTTFMDSRHDALVSLFTHRVIVTDLSLGSLMEISERMMPAVTIECGGAQDPESNLMATEGLRRYFSLADVLGVDHTDVSLEFFHNPLRLELLEGSEIAYGEHNLLSDGVTLLPEVEHFNFGFVSPETKLGFVSGNIATALTVKNRAGDELVSSLFEVRAGGLYPKRILKLFMVTTNPEIARKDCLFYLTEPEEER